MEDFYEQRLSTKLQVAGIVFFLACYAVLSSFLEHRKLPIHRGAVAVIIGVVTGLGMLLILGDVYEKVAKMDQTIIFLVLLPVMLFAKGYTFKKGAFMRNIKFIVLFGIIGTFISYIVITLLIYAANQMNLIRDAKDITSVRTLSIWQILLLSACLCSIDTVASEDAIDEDKYQKLNSIMMGQDTFKDCVTIVLFRSILKLEQMETPDTFIFYWYTPLKVLLNFLIMIFGSIAFGIIMAAFTTFLFRKSRYLLKDNGVTQTTVLFLLGFTTYILAQCMQISGIVSILCFGVVLNRYNYFNLSPHGQVSSNEGLMFLIMGIMVWEVQWQKESPDNPMTHSYLFCFVVMMILIAGRAINIYLLWFIASRINPTFKLNKQELFIIFLGGIARGATPFAMFASVELGQSEYTKNEGLILKTTIIIVVMFCTIFLNSAIPRIYKKPLESLKQEAKKELIQKHNRRKEEQKGVRQIARKTFKQLEQNSIKPFLIYKYTERKDEIKLKEKQIKEQQYRQALASFDEDDNGHLHGHEELQKSSHQDLESSLISSN